MACGRLLQWAAGNQAPVEGHFQGAGLAANKAGRDLAAWPNLTRPLHPVSRYLPKLPRYEAASTAWPAAARRVPLRHWTACLSGYRPGSVAGAERVHARHVALNGQLPPASALLPGRSTARGHIISNSKDVRNLPLCPLAPLPPLAHDASSHRVGRSAVAAGQRICRASAMFRISDKVRFLPRSMGRRAMRH